MCKFSSIIHRRNKKKPLFNLLFAYSITCVFGISCKHFLFVFKISGCTDFRETFCICFTITYMKTLLDIWNYCYTHYLEINGRFSNTYFSAGLDVLSDRLAISCILMNLLITYLVNIIVWLLPFNFISFNNLFEYTLCLKMSLI